VRPTAGPVAALLGIAWLGTFLPASLPPLAVAHWPAEWARHLAAGWPGTAPVVRYALGWLIVGALLRTLPGAARAWRTLALAAAAVLALRFTWLVGEAGNAELAGAALALAAWPAAERLPGAWLERLLAAAATAAVLYAHLAPHAAVAHAHGWHWMPFTDLGGAGGGGLRVALLCAKLFWYGALVWLLVAAGLGAPAAGVGVAAAVLLVQVVARAASSVQYATTTDSAIALAVGLAIALLARGSAAR
jgi:hypothetical protein